MDIGIVVFFGVFSPFSPTLRPMVATHAHALKLQEVGKFANRWLAIRTKHCMTTVDLVNGLLFTLELYTTYELLMTIKNEYTLRKSNEHACFNQLTWRLH